MADFILFINRITRMGLRSKNTRRRKRGKKSKKSIKNRKIMPRGGRSFYYRLPESYDSKKVDSDFKTFGELRRHIMNENPGYYVLLKKDSGMRWEEDDSVDLVAEYYKYRLEKQVEPTQLADVIMDYELDYRLIDRKTLKFAGSQSGSQNTAPIKIAMKTYTPEQKKQLLAELSKRLGHNIDFCDMSVTFYDKEVADKLLQLFNESGLLKDFENNVCALLKSPNETPNKMDYIYILFGEILKIPGGPDPVYLKNKGMNFSPDISFENFSPVIQKIILDLKRHVLGS